MHHTVEPMKHEDWEEVVAIYKEGMDTQLATFVTKLPTWEEWDRAHHKVCRFVAKEADEVIGWIALSPTSSMCAYRGVAEVSIYIKTTHKGKGVGKRLFETLIEDSEREGFWTLESLIVRENTPSIALHKKCGFKEAGIRERLGAMPNGKWHDVVVMERRSTQIGM